MTLTGARRREWLRPEGLPYPEMTWIARQRTTSRVINARDGSEEWREDVLSMDARFPSLSRLVRQSLRDRLCCQRILFESRQGRHERVHDGRNVSRPDHSRG